MMKQTATVQANIDFSDEKDAMAKFRAGMGLTPLIIGMFANSPISEGQLNGYRSLREHIWTGTDKARCGLLRFAFSPDVSFRHYMEYALDVPMYFIIRNHDYIDMTAVTFRQFLKNGYNGERPTLEDWNDHLTTLFPETRIKRYALLDLAKELFQIAWEGLTRQKVLNEKGEDETIYLNTLKTLLFQGKCPADVLIEKWEGELQHDIKKLIAYTAYKLP